MEDGEPVQALPPHNPGKGQKSKLIERLWEREAGTMPWEGMALESNGRISSANSMVITMCRKAVHHGPVTVHEDGTVEAVEEVADVGNVECNLNARTTMPAHLTEEAD
ncbi:hypothetical protein niasHS_015745 [Heterodera schachtii]|uniref:Uncharacterized protein n=1 Tax=Heterodera schachtii TaxID=97005 RepID=A0ABD2HST7_HETSC